MIEPGSKILYASKDRAFADEISSNGRFSYGAVHTGHLEKPFLELDDVAAVVIVGSLLGEKCTRVLNDRLEYVLFLDQARDKGLPVVAVLPKRYDLPNHNDRVDHVVRSEGKTVAKITDAIFEYLTQQQD